MVMKEGSYLMLYVANISKYKYDMEESSKNLIMGQKDTHKSNSYRRARIELRKMIYLYLRYLISMHWTVQHQFTDVCKTLR